MTKKNKIIYWGIIVLTISSISIAYWSIWLKWIQDLWKDPNYSHGLLVPFISAYIAWQKRGDFKRNSVYPWPPGLLVVLTGVLLYVVGSIAGELFTKRLSFLMVFWGVIFSFIGPRAARPFMFPLFYLIFAVPLPYIIYDSIGFPLKLLASSCATWILHLFGFPVYREGNLLYLPNMTLEVVDACSGIRSLMSILALAMLVAWLMHKDIIRRAVTCMMAIPVVLITNSLRIVITGILAVKRPEMALGFFHSFEGELMFLIGVAILIGISKMLRGGTAKGEPQSVKVEGDGELESAHGDYDARSGFSYVSLASIAILVLLGYSLTRTAASVRPFGLNESFQAFPKTIGDFVEVDEEEMPPRVIEVLGVDSYMLRAYRHKSGYVLWLYIGYFEEQKEGAMIHSPKHCYPGSGWSPVRAKEITLNVKVGPDPDGVAKFIKINEYLLQKGESYQMVYYWYHSRGRVIANEYVDRLFMIIDSLLRHRSDGALVRISGAVDHDETQKALLKEFIEELFPYLREFLPT